jgi:hypothetical protein
MSTWSNQNHLVWNSPNDTNHMGCNPPIGITQLSTVQHGTTWLATTLVDCTTTSGTWCNWGRCTSRMSV